MQIACQLTPSTHNNSHAAHAMHFPWERWAQTLPSMPPHSLAIGVRIHPCRLGTLANSSGAHSITLASGAVHVLTHAERGKQSSAARGRHLAPTSQPRGRRSLAFAINVRIALDRRARTLQTADRTYHGACNTAGGASSAASASTGRRPRGRRCTRRPRCSMAALAGGTSGDCDQTRRT